MTLADILGLEKILGITVDLEKKTFDLNFLGSSIKGIKYSTIKELMKDNSNTEELLSEMFNRKQVMWQDFARETVDLCLRSLEDLKQKCDNASKKFSATQKLKDMFYASLLRLWADQCDIAIKEFLTAKEHEKISLELDFGSGSYMRANHEIPRILGAFRASTLPTVKELTKLLPENNPIRKEAEKNINFATNVTIRNYEIQSDQIQDGSYELHK
jgi:hypothetical protein